MLSFATLSALLPLLFPVVAADHLRNPAPQIFFPPSPDDVLHPEWPDRQAALGWSGKHASEGSGVVGSGPGACGGVCVLTPEVMEGPFYIDYHLPRSNITEGLPGLPLSLTIHLYSISSHLSDPTLPHSTCTLLSNAWVDIWSCEAEAGIYSGYGKAAEGGPDGPGGPPDWPGKGPSKGPGRPPHGPPGGPGGPPMHVEPINNSTFLRGIQQTDAEGKVTFDMIYPGWYPGRTVHIHMKTHAPAWGGDAAAMSNETHTHTTQIFFPQELNDQVAEHPIYAKNGARRITNAQDGLFEEMEGASVVKIDQGMNGDEAIEASLAVGVDMWW
ncbi:hypothetical protein I350_01579 [Cryptococcus amylolentus CBS 6273]|uniref:Intradiol ring-cleavage dioxygenases domain-containing protein n=1 Tax=Cryptococcus amylolentus CBS 6273 TaxID=1296118 RepID=A0A1E3KD07_9TREE|nr:hypothetical protein I350_01579 [Cryptococcus amylolentus CBS 6273]